MSICFHRIRIRFEGTFHAFASCEVSGLGESEIPLYTTYISQSEINHNQNYLKK